MTIQFTQKIDRQSRVTIPVSIRKLMDINTDDFVTFDVLAVTKKGEHDGN